MSLLDPPFCPQCKSEVELADLWSVVPKFGFLAMMKRVGVVCPQCGAGLRVLPSLSSLSVALGLVFVVFVGVIAAWFVPVGWGALHRRERGLWVVAGLIALSGLAIQESFAPRLLRLRLLNPEEVVTFPVKVPATERSTSPEAADIKENDKRPTWVCPKCGEQNPGNFDECWKCQTWRAEESSGN
jgi:predicted RNA-binding Zn-ribbon protein involved in translation (DUF1610 family)